MSQRRAGGFGRVVRVGAAALLGVVTAVAGACARASADPGAPQAAPATGSVTVEVTAAGAPTAARVRLYSTSSGEFWDDIDGSPAVFDDLPVDTYLVLVQSLTAGYASEWYPSTPYRSHARTITVRRGSDQTLDVALEQELVISGRVFKPNGQPEDAGAGLFVQIDLAGGVPGDAIDGRCGVDTSGEPAGSYAWGCLHPNGRYLVYRDGSATVAAQYHPDADNPDDAVPVTGTPGQRVTGIDFRPDAAPSPITVDRFSATQFRVGTTTPGVRIFGSHFPSNPNTMYVEAEPWEGDPPIEFTVTEVLSTTEAVVTVAIGLEDETRSALDASPGARGVDAVTPVQRNVTVGSYAGSEVACGDCFSYTGTAAAPTGSVRSITPARLLDTRAGEQTTDDGFAGEGRLAAGSVLELTVRNRGLVPKYLPSAVMLNVAAVFPESPGFLTVWPCGVARPLASSVNYSAGVVVSNAVLASVGAFDRVCIYTSAATDLVVDVNGWVPNVGSPATLVPARLLDTRPGEETVDDDFAGGGVRAAGSTLELTVAGRGGVPDDADAVMLNVVAVLPGAPGFVTVWPCGVTRPLASSLNYSTGAVVPNAVLAKVGADGKVCLYTSASTHLVADVNGYVPDGGSPSTLVPARLLDTRPGEQTVDGTFAGGGLRAAGSTLELTVRGRGDVPSDAATVMLNVAAVLPDAPGFVTVWPCGQPRPLASTLNYAAGAVVPNAVLAKVGSGGKVCLYTSAATHLVADVNAAVGAG